MSTANVDFQRTNGSRVQTPWLGFARAFFGVATSAFLIAGCATVGVTPLQSHLVEKPANCALDVFTSENAVGRAYEELCLIDARTATNAFADKSVAGAIELAKPHACKCGADAIIITNGATEGASFTGWGMGSAVLHAIRYK